MNKNKQDCLELLKQIDAYRIQAQIMLQNLEPDAVCDKVLYTLQYANNNMQYAVADLTATHKAKELQHDNQLD